MSFFFSFELLELVKIRSQFHRLLICYVGYRERETILEIIKFDNRFANYDDTLKQRINIMMNFFISR